MQPYLLSEEELKSYYIPTKLTAKTEPIFDVSMTFNKFGSSMIDWSTSNEVLPNVYLGRIPEDTNYPDRTKLVVSVVTHGELSKVDFDYLYLEKNGTQHIFVNMVDFTCDVSHKMVINTIKTMLAYDEMNDKKIRENGHKILIFDKMPIDLEKNDEYYGKYMILRSQIVNTPITTIKYVRTDGIVTDVKIKNFSPLYIELLECEDNYFVVSEKLIKTVTEHFPSHHSDHNIYVHCKAGRSRSAMIVAIFGAYKKLKTMDDHSQDNINKVLDNTIEKIIYYRKQVSIESKKRSKAREILTELLNESSIIENNNIQYESPAEYIMSLEFKNVISQTTTFKMMCKYLSSLRDTQSRNDHLLSFLLQILNTKTILDVTELMKLEKLYRFRDSNPSVLKIDDREYRSYLVTRFIDDLKTLLSKYEKNIINEEHLCI